MMRVLEVPGRAVEQVLQMQLDISAATDPQKLTMDFMGRFAEFSAIRYIVSVFIGENPGEYHVMDRQHLANVPDSLVDEHCYWVRDELPPAERGGVIAELIEDGAPKVVHHLDVGADPVLGDAVARYGSCVVIPIYENGVITEWGIGFLDGAEEATQELLLRTLPIANHVATTAKYLKASGTMRALTSELSQQFDEIGRVQRSLLPREIPEIPGVALATRYRTSKQAGGDYYGFYEFQPGHWGIVIADVSGHGAAAATVMAMLQSIISSFAALRQGEPIGMVEHLNAQLCRSLGGGMFVTAFFMVYRLDTGGIFYTCCGHNPPRVLRAKTGAIETLCKGAGLPLGIEEGIPLESAHDRLEPGDILVLYTDGITESFNRAGDMFGTERLDEAIRAAGPKPDNIAAAIMSRVDGFTGRADCTDDQTLVIVRREPAS